MTEEAKLARLVARLWSQTEPGPGGCLLFTGRLGNGGYGIVQSRWPDGKQHNYAAHRLSYMLRVGPIPDGLIVRHACDVRPCIEPTHLLVGTKSDNTRDMWARDRQGAHLRRSVTCRACGASDWRDDKRGKRYCYPCHLRLCAAGDRRRRAARSLPLD